MPIGVAQLRALVAVVDAGGFGAAADRLGLSQSAVSHAIASLERMAGRSVLTRDVPPRPTALGQQILDQARIALTAVSAIDELVYRRDDRVRGELALAAPPTICHGLLPDLLGRWRLDYPDVQIRLFEGDDDEVAGWLDAATADLAVLVDPPAERTTGTVLGSDTFHAVLRSDHPLAGQPEIDLADLTDDDILLSTGGCERHVRELCRMAGVSFAPVRRVRQLGTLFAMVRAGLGVSVVPGLAAGMKGADVVMVPLTQRLRRTLVLTGPPGRPWHPLAVALVDGLPKPRPAVVAPVQALAS